MEHDLAHDLPDSDELLKDQYIYLRAWGLTFLTVGLVLVGSMVSGSLALLADIGHVVTDSLIALIPLSATYLVRRGWNVQKVQRYSGFVAAGFLLFIGYHVIEEALTGISHGADEHHVEGAWLFIFALGAAAVNYFQHRILSNVSPMHRHAAHSGYHFHVLTDLVKNILLPILAVALILGANEIWDLYAALAIGGLIILRALILLFEAWIGEQIVQRFLHRASDAFFR
jgi:cobalt-zinc-cadmium efflux system protein